MMSCRSRSPPHAEPTSSLSTKAPPRRAPSCSTRRSTPVADCAAKFHPAFSRRRPGRARSGRDLAERGRNSAWRDGAGGRRRRRRRCDRHHQPARDHADLGSREREPDPSGDRLAGPAHRRRLRLPARGRPRAGRHAEDRAAARSVFSTTKIAWLLDHVDGARKAALRQGRLAFGTIDTWLLWRLTGDLSLHATGCRPARRAALSTSRCATWDRRAAPSCFACQMSLLHEVRGCAGDFGTDRTCSAARSAIMGVAGDQQAATGRAGLLRARHDQISTYGTGCFALLNTGAQMVQSRNRLLTTIAYQLAGKRTYALEGSIFIAGAAVQWLRDGLKIIRNAPDSGALAIEADPGEQVYMVPAFVGLGAPWWDASARGRSSGLTRKSGPAEDRARRRSRRSATRPATCIDAIAPTGHRGRQHGAARRRRHERRRLHHAVPRRHPRCAGRSSGRDGTIALDAAYLAVRRRRMRGAGPPCPNRGSASAASCRAMDAKRARAEMGQLAGRGAADVECRKVFGSRILL